MTTEQPKPGPQKSSLGLDENIALLLCYVAGWVSGIIFYVIEKENKNVKFAAMQSIFVFGGLTALMIVCGILSMIPYLGFVFSILGSVLGLAGFVAWILLVVKSLQGEVYKVPVVGEMAEKYVK